MTDYHPDLNPNGFDGVELDAKREEVDAKPNTATNGGAIFIKADKRFKAGNVVRKGRELRGNPETVKIERMEAPPTYFNPPYVITRELAKKMKEIL